jgi:hypothetical protein
MTHVPSRAREEDIGSISEHCQKAKATNTWRPNKRQKIRITTTPTGRSGTRMTPRSSGEGGATTMMPRSTGEGGQQHMLDGSRERQRHVTSIHLTAPLLLVNNHICRVTKITFHCTGYVFKRYNLDSGNNSRLKLKHMTTSQQLLSHYH